MHLFGVPKLRSIQSSPMDPKWCLGVFWSILLTFSTWKLQNLCLSQNALLRGTKVVKHPFLSIGHKMVFGRVSEHFTNLRHVKRWKICVFGLNALFRCTEVVEHPTYSIGPQWCLGVFHSISLTFCMLKDAKLVFKSACTISRYQSCVASILLYWTQNYVWEYFEALC
jgi:hypothetical protein